MNTSGVAEGDALIGSDTPSKHRDDFLSREDSHELRTRASYDEYHKVCDMRKVFDTSLIGCCGICLTFLLILTSWCGWHESVEYVGVNSGLTGRSLVEYSAIVNSVAVFILISSIVIMRFTVGPVLSYHWRSVFAVLLVLTAITAWEAFEAAFDVLIGSESKDRATVYLIACAASCIATFIFERVYQYDVIGRHLIIPP